MANKKFLDQLKAELEDWRKRLDQLRMKTDMSTQEARDILKEFGTKLEPAVKEAQRRIDHAVTDGASEVQTLGKSLRAGWEEVRRKYGELSHEAERKKSGKGS